MTSTYFSPRSRTPSRLEGGIGRVEESVKVLADTGLQVP